jgi:hypothetical protein
MPIARHRIATPVAWEFSLAVCRRLKLASHLGVDGEFFGSIPEEELKEHVFAGPGHSLRPSLRRFLTIPYGRKIERLQGILDRDLSHWLPE